LAEITDRESFEKWLEGKPVEWAQVLAVRVALRVLPLVAQVFDAESIKPKYPQHLIFTSWRAIAISWVARKYPTHDIAHAARAAADAASAADAFAFAAADAVAFAAARAANAADAADAAARAAFAADAVVFAAARANYVVAFSLFAVTRAADDAFAAAGFWSALNRDAEFLAAYKGTPEFSAQALAEQVLWLNDEGENVIPDWAVDEFKNLTINLSGFNDNWQVWGEWYQSRLDGKESWGLNAENAETLMLRISEQENDWWEQGPSIVYAEIAGWLSDLRAEEAKEQNAPIFISYSTINEDIAKEVGQVIESINYPVFAQYKDMPSGSNFITEMQDGLENMGRMVSLYSPEYFASDICQDEWNVAYNLDRGGRKRKIIGFKIAPCELKPLQKQIVYTPLYGLSKADASEAIRHALNWNGENLSPQEGRKAAAISASPLPVNNEDGMIGVSINNAFDNPFIDSELPKLPEIMRQRINAVLKALKNKNAPSMVTTSLQDYLTELNTNGLTPSIPNLRGLIEIIQAEIADPLGNWYSGGIEVAISQILSIHAQIIDRFPLDAKRERYIRESPIDPEIFDLDEFNSIFEKYLAKSVDLSIEGLADDEFSRVAEIRQRRYRDITSLKEKEIGADLSEEFIAGSNTITPADIKKRYLFQESGFADKLLERGAKISAIADSEAGKSLLDIAKKVIKLIWNGEG